METTRCQVTMKRDDKKRVQEMVNAGWRLSRFTEGTQNGQIVVTFERDTTSWQVAAASGHARSRAATRNRLVDSPTRSE